MKRRPCYAPLLTVAFTPALLPLQVDILAGTIKSSIASFVSAGDITCGSTINVAGRTDGQYLFQCSATSVVSGVQAFIVPQLCCSPPP